MTQQYIVEQYTFDKVAKTIRLPSIPNLKLEGIQLITNLTTGTLIYQFNSVALGGTVTGDVLTLTYNTDAMSNSDRLQILYNPPTGGVYDRLLSLFYQLVELVRAPNFVVRLTAGDTLRVLPDPNTTLGSVGAITTLNNIDSREVPWALWDLEYTTGIRNKIV